METDLEQIISAVDERPTMAAYLQAARQVRQSPARRLLRPVRVALLATFTIDGLAPYLEVEAARHNFAVDLYTGPFNSVRQELLNPASGCVRHQPDVIFVAQQLADMCPPLVNDFLVLDDAQKERYIEEIVAELEAALKSFRQFSPAAVVVHNFAPPLYPPLGIYEAMAPGSLTDVTRRLNSRLVEAARAVPDVYVLDYDRLGADVGYRNWHDDKMWYLGRSPLSAQAMLELARRQAAFVRAIKGSPRKCLVLDLDNTLWGGVIGESGVAGIKLGHTYPGNAFRDFQQTILGLHRRGVLLAINSKNNEADVAEVFRAHPDMVLKLEHFACTRINWREKPANMVEIAAELNIGLDSLVFFDDNPVEGARMRQALPEVLTLEVPPDPLKYRQILLGSGAFDRLSFTSEDRRRGAMYREQVARRRLEQSAHSLEDFLRSLEMSVTIRAVDEFAFPRVVDLLHKTNQFNLTTRRHTAGEVAEMIADPACGVFELRARDRFGDNGIVGVGIVRTTATAATATIDTLLLSCRVIGRTIETAFLSFLADWARAKGARVIEGEFIPTAKNAPAADFYPQHGFRQIGGNGTGPQLWQLRLDDVPFEWPDYIGAAEETKA